MRTKTMMLTMILLLASASVIPAHDTAWVLWAKIEDIKPGSGVWDIQAGYTGRAECIRERKVISNARVQDWIKRSGQQHVKVEQVSEDALSLLFSKDELVTVYFICLPDTLDPREKKG